jgi:hypothetical protein
LRHARRNIFFGDQRSERCAESLVGRVVLERLLAHPDQARDGGFNHTKLGQRRHNVVDRLVGLLGRGAGRLECRRDLIQPANCFLDSIQNDFSV